MVGRKSSADVKQPGRLISLVTQNLPKVYTFKPFKVQGLIMVVVVEGRRKTLMI